MFQTLLLVALGGALGASARFLVTLACLRILSPAFPWATLGVNVLGSFLMGLLFVILTARPGPLMPFLLTGILGGFTTFSAFSLESVSLWQRGDPGLAVAYVAASVALSLAALVAGMGLARGVFA